MTETLTFLIGPAIGLLAALAAGLYGWSLWTRERTAAPQLTTRATMRPLFAGTIILVSLFGGLLAILRVGVLS